MSGCESCHIRGGREKRLALPHTRDIVGFEVCKPCDVQRTASTSPVHHCRACSSSLKHFTECGNLMLEFTALKSPKRGRTPAPEAPFIRESVKE